jgi:COP9 signalosome complex subunit 5
MDSAKAGALKQFEIENDIVTEDALFEFNEDEYQKLLAERPWKKDPLYFKKVKISAIALIKMVAHAKSGGDLEVMGLMQGKASGDTLIILDSYPIPVEGTETRVNASADANIYISRYAELGDEVKRLEGNIGWYHSHPSYGCWLSGIDVATENIYQMTGPFVAVVIDPIRTMTTGRVEIGAFRTFPEGYKPSRDTKVEQDLVPETKVEDFGMHHDRYYSIPVSYFKSSLDNTIIETLWNKYWIDTLSNSAISQNKQYFSETCCDLSKKVAKLMKSNNYNKVITLETLISKNKSDYKDYLKYSSERTQALLQEAVKGVIFGSK